MFKYVFVTVDVKIPSIELGAMCQLVYLQYVEVVYLVAACTVWVVLYV